MKAKRVWGRDGAHSRQGLPVSDFWCNFGSAEESEAHLGFFFKGAELAPGQWKAEIACCNNKSAAQPGAHNSAAARLDEVTSCKSVALLEMYRNVAKESKEFLQVGT